ncbi:MAG TPA: YuzB family protein [Candidatus Pseudogracilibacillus intestinigallinarum]|uniref:YuzB family protein n=1 Tax=Candidatus Pseudogracilibacillus intestinigallinarum TaxID=2838742 RepID=A0A9D1PQ20_9BACI|nr:YuzB family protein [Candidatus Pseudogracilibacillus intestinigallinarum]
MGIVVVDVCSVNPIMTLDIETIIESEYPEVAVIVNSCLSFCGLCANSPYAQVNGKLVHGKTAEQCLNNIRTQIEKELEMYA